MSSLKPRIAISVGDLNGVGIHIALLAHQQISQWCEPIYCINDTMLQHAASLLALEVPSDFQISDVEGEFQIKPGVIDALSGEYSYRSFMHAISLCEDKIVDAIVTLPIHKEAWHKAGLHYVGHTDLLRKHYKKDAIMMLGVEQMYVALFTEHIPLHKVASEIQTPKLMHFFRDFNKAVHPEKVAVLGLNPHAGDHGVLGDEEQEISMAIELINAKEGREVFVGPLVPDIAFTPSMREQYQYYIAMYHDQGLAPLKALYFDEAINVSLNLPVIRTSVDHGTAFDIAYKKEPKRLSYKNAVLSAIKFSQNRENFGKV